MHTIGTAVISLCVMAASGPSSTRVAFDAYELTVKRGGNAALKIRGKLLSDSIGPYIPSSWGRAQNVEIRETTVEGSTVITFTGRRRTKKVDFACEHRFTCRPDTLTVNCVLDVVAVRNPVEVANFYLPIQPETAIGHRFAFPSGKEMTYPKRPGDRELWPGTFQSPGPCVVKMLAFNGMDVTVDWQVCGSVEVYDWVSPAGDARLLKTATRFHGLPMSRPGQQVKLALSLTFKPSTSQPAAREAPAPTKPEPPKAQWVGDETKWHDVLANSIVFGAQADLHSFNRIPRPYMMKVLADLPKVQADFFAVVGDLVGRHTGLDLARESSVPLFFVYGDHENFEEWGYIRQAGPVPPRSRGGWRRHHGGVFNAMCSDMPLTQAWTGLPYFWSLDYKGVHFVFGYSGKNLSSPSWFLQWLRRDLDEHRDQTTVIFTHRCLFEFGERWNLPKQWETLIKNSPQVKLVVYGHYHYPRAIEMLGDHALTIDCELTPDFRGRKGETFEGGFYGLWSVAPDAIRIWARYPDTGKMVLIDERPLPTTYRPDAQPALSLPYLVSQSSKHYVPALDLTDARLRLWGVEVEQLVPNALLSDDEIPWRSMDGVTLRPVDGDAGPPRLSRMLEVRIGRAVGTQQAPARLARLSIDKVRFDRVPISERMVTVENAYTALLLVKAPAGRNVWLVMDTLRADGSVEATYATKVRSDDPQRLHYIFQQVYATYVRSKRSWVWCPGPKGREDTDIAYGVEGPRQANRLALYLATPDTVENETWQVALFVYVTGAPYAPAPFGRSHAQNVAVSVGGQRFNAAELREGKPQEWRLGSLYGGTPFEVEKCDGSRLALLELTGKTNGLMQFDLRQIQQGEPRLLTGGSSCGGAPNPATNGLSVLSLLRSATVNGEPMAAHKARAVRLSAGATITSP